ncbi:MAG: hypothetical protein K2J63_02245 [Muribaculaceae bacterium]|nr:hypothetical protein [Muribaculaceae bacterium]
MSKTKEMKDVFKDAQVVTSLGSSDRLMVVDANGNPKRISQNDATRQAVSLRPGTSQWIRVAKFTETAAAILELTTQWSNVSGSRVLVAVILHSHSEFYNKIKILSCLLNSGSTVAALTKLRVLIKKSAECYLEVYYAPSAANPVSVELIAPFNMSIVTPVVNPTIPEGYAVKEFDLTAVVGGGKSLCFNQLRNLAERRVA